MEVKVHIEHDPRFRGTAIYLYGKDGKGEFVIQPIPFVVEYKSADESFSPTFIFDRGTDGDTFLQSFASELVRLGYKPDELKSKDNEVSAIKYHLEDMRNLVFKKKVS